MDTGGKNVPWKARISLPVDVSPHLDRDGRGCDAQVYCGQEGLGDLQDDPQAGGLCSPRLHSWTIGPGCRVWQHNALIHGGTRVKGHQLLVLAAKIWTSSNIPQETPTREWLRQYLLVTLGSGVYDAWEKKDLIWAIYSYFTWKTPIKTDAGINEAIYDLAVLAGLPKPDDGSKILPQLYSTYKALGLSEAVGTIERARKAAEEAERARKEEETRRAVEAERARKAVEEARMAAKLSPIISDEIKQAAFKATEKYGDKPLVTATERGDEGVVRTLIAAGYKDLEERDANGNTALMMAASKGYKSILFALLDCGADKEAKNKVSDPPGQSCVLDLSYHDYGPFCTLQDRRTALILAAMRIQAASEGCVRLLEDEGAEKYVKDIDGMTYLDHAKVARKYVMLNNAARTKYGEYPLSTAAENGDDETVKALIAAGYQDLNECDLYKTQALMTYAERGCESMLKALIVAGADMDIEKHGYTPLMKAAMKGHEGCVRLLVEAGAERTPWRKYNTYTRSYDTYSALSLAKTEAIKAILCS